MISSFPFYARVEYFRSGLAFAEPKSFRHDFDVNLVPGAAQPGNRRRNVQGQILLADLLSSELERLFVGERQ